MPKHIMNFTSEHEETETWICPTCGRILLIEHSPWKQTVIVEGDISASHSGSRGFSIITNADKKQD